MLRLVKEYFKNAECPPKNIHHMDRLVPLLGESLSNKGFVFTSLFLICKMKEGLKHQKIAFFNNMK